ncbi:hypothetical protein TWF694_000556 [Orbilia ellipsospora]|uniref:G domain-containing protein n=1 Tax=Orbilia ellipsospora TaxID=2528407 RepID=A0AAV9XPE2_9PEZI
MFFDRSGYRNQKSKAAEKTTPNTPPPASTPAEFESSGKSESGHETGVPAACSRDSSAEGSNCSISSHNEQTQGRGTNVEHWSPEALHTHAHTVRSSNAVNEKTASRIESELRTVGSNTETVIRRRLVKTETASSGGLVSENSSILTLDSTRKSLESLGPVSTARETVVASISTGSTTESFSTFIPVETERSHSEQVSSSALSSVYSATAFGQADTMFHLAFGKKDADKLRFLVMIATSVAFLATFWMTFQVGDQQVGLTPSSPIIAIMGETGAGKSSFIKALGGLDENGQPPIVGHNLNSTTKSVSWYSAAVGRRGFYVLDTPGFDDSYMSDFEILESLTRELAQIYTAARPLTGIIYVHDVSKEKMGGTSYKSLQTFQKLVGDTSLKNVVLVTTHWRTFFYSAQEQREEELRRTFWASMIARGSGIVRHDGSRKSTLRIVQELLNRKPVTIKIVDEMVNDGMRFEQTEAGSTVKEGLDILGQKLDYNVQALNEEIYDLRTKQKQIEEAAALEKKMLEEQWKKSSQDQRGDVEKKMKILEARLAEQMRELNSQLLNIQKEKEGMQTHIDELKRANKVLQDKLDEREQNIKGGTNQKQNNENEPKERMKADQKLEQKPQAYDEEKSFLQSCRRVAMWFYGFADPMFVLGPWTDEAIRPFLYLVFAPILGIFCWFVGELKFSYMVLTILMILVEGALTNPAGVYRGKIPQVWLTILAAGGFALAGDAHSTIISSLLAMVWYGIPHGSLLFTAGATDVVFLAVLLLLVLIFAMNRMLGHPSARRSYEYEQLQQIQKKLQEGYPGSGELIDWDEVGRYMKSTHWQEYVKAKENT